ncbi:MAG: PDDEXK nuclease domain-containing protein [Coriobacteriia bacterium]|nr:PDDEXK nuclease domain-containing protein [Coriobacteriia bacterium]MCL2537714.1 PDDEXK nuclease domain-containing protein [Coriobacteriia bacterium]
MIEESRSRTAAAVNAEITLLYWHVGTRINREILANARAEYGKEVVEGTSKFLTQIYGRGWSPQQLWQCIKLSTVLQKDILYSLSIELSWTHIRTIMYINDPVKRDLYFEMAKAERWSVAQLRGRINSLMFERTAISKKPESLIAQELSALSSGATISPDLAFRDPVLLDYLGLADTYSEQDLESAIVAEIQRFIIEMGSDFAFMARQKRMTIDGRDYYLDLLFYHRRLRCLVALELKLGEFEAAYKGQMELYLRWLEKYELIEGENLPIGLILCSGKSEEHIELMRLDESNIRVAEYLTTLPDLKLLEEKLKASIELARAQCQRVE